MSDVFIGTSGFEYKDWGPKFYPKELPQKEHLAFFSKHFKTLELNVSFYHLPKAETFNKWAQTVPDNFRFAVKISRYITHRKKLHDVEEPWKNFLHNAEHLGKKLGPFLLQFPASWKKNIERLEDFLDILANSGPQHRYAFEFRHSSWFDEELYSLFERHKKLKITLVMAYSSSKWPLIKKITGTFVYIRMHGAKELYASKYSEKALEELAGGICLYLKQNLDVYVYFNNDVHGFAIDDATFLQNCLQIS